jgi:hypothetical protein
MRRTRVFLGPRRKFIELVSFSPRGRRAKEVGMRCRFFARHQKPHYSQKQ